MIIDTTPPVIIGGATPVPPNAPALEASSNTGIIPGNDDTSDNKPVFDVSVVSGQSWETVELLRNGVGGEHPPARPRRLPANGVVADPGSGSGSGRGIRLHDHPDRRGGQRELPPARQDDGDDRHHRRPLPAAPAQLDPAGDSAAATRATASTSRASTSPYFNISGIEPNATVELFRDGVLVATLNVTAWRHGGDPRSGPGARWGLHLHGRADRPGGQRQRDEPRRDRSTIDTTAPAAPGVPVLLPSSDTGISNSDDITKDTHPIFAIAPAAQDGDGPAPAQARRAAQLGLCRRGHDHAVGSGQRPGQRAGGHRGPQWGVRLRLAADRPGRQRGADQQPAGRDDRHDRAGRADESAAQPDPADRGRRATAAGAAPTTSPTSRTRSSTSPASRPSATPSSCSATARW